MTPLDRPVWSSLTTSQRALGEGDELARRYRPKVNLFAGTRDDGPESLARLSALLAPGDQAILAETRTVATPPGLTRRLSALAVQLVDGGAARRAEPGRDIQPLGAEAAGEMLALARLTEPAPFLPETPIMGDFFGIRVEGRLVAMAGERMRFPGYREISGVCTHPEFRGRGHARRLTTHVAASIRARGETPFLHAWKTNEAAIRVYEDLGFRRRRELQVMVFEKPSAS